VSSSSKVGEAVEGWTGRLHGWLIAAWLDEVIGQCLLARREFGFIAKLNLRYSLRWCRKHP